jgi:hypothetical protein
LLGTRLRNTMCSTISGPNWKRTPRSGRAVNTMAKKQVFMTPGLAVARIHIHNRIGVTLGSGMQIALTSYHQYNHSLILTARLPF